MSSHLLIRSLAAILLVAGSASAATVTWLGTTSNDWATGANWDVGYAPGYSTADTASIPAVTSPAFTPVVTGVQPSGSGSITTTTIGSGASLQISGTLNTTQLTISASGSTGGSLTVDAGATANFQGTSSLSHYWNAGTATIRGIATENRNLYFGNGGSSTASRTMTVSLLNGGRLSTGNQCAFTLGNGSYNTGVFNIWGADGSATGSLWSNGNSAPRLNYNGGSSYISLKDGGRIEYNTGHDSTFQTAITNNVIRSGDIRQIIVKDYVPGSTTRYRITTQVMDKAYNPMPTSAGPNPATMTLVSLGTVGVDWTAPIARNYTDSIVCKVYASFATGTYPVDSNGYPADPNGDLLPLYTTITRPAQMGLNMTTIVAGRYQWRVDCVDHSKDGVDPNYPLTTKGDVWYFRTGNSAPVANAGTTQVLGLVGGAATFTSDATITDDGLPIGGAVTGEWVQLSGPTVVAGLPATVTAASPNVALSLTAAGRYRFQLTPYDTSLYGTASIVEADVYSDSCVAAKAGTWTAMQGDFNLDCKVDGKDLALMIADWLRCTDAISGCN